MIKPINSISRSLSQSPGSTSKLVDWAQIDTVILDMDGTLLDLHFDNFFWSEVIPVTYAEANGMTKQAAINHWAGYFEALRGSLDWYCIDHWSEKLQLDLMALKGNYLEKMTFLPGVKAFLQWLRAERKTLYLATNAHPDVLAFKDQHLAVSDYFDRCFSSHEFGQPKEAEKFWPAFRSAADFDPGRTLFADDTISVLNAAKSFGIEETILITQPDMQQPVREVGGYKSVQRLSDLAP